MTATATPTRLDALVVEVQPLDQALARHGVVPTSRYAELYWLPVIGPTALLLGRRLFALTVGKGAEDYERRAVDVEQLSVALGVGGHSSKRSPLLRALRRLHSFGLLSLAEDGFVSLPRRWPPLAARHVARLPAGLQTMHAQHQSPENGAQ